MPMKVIRGAARRTGKTVSAMEQKWKRCIREQKAGKSTDNVYALCTSIFRDIGRKRKRR